MNEQSYSRYVDGIESRQAWVSKCILKKKCIFHTHWFKAVWSLIQPKMLLKVTGRHLERVSLSLSLIHIYCYTLCHYASLGFREWFSDWKMGAEIGLGSVRVRCCLEQTQNLKLKLGLYSTFINNSTLGYKSLYKEIFFAIIMILQNIFSGKIRSIIKSQRNAFIEGRLLIFSISKSYLFIIIFW